MELHNTNSNPANQLEQLRRDYDELKRKLEKSISQQKHIEKKLNESEQRFAVLFRKSVFPAIVTRLTDGVIVDVNEAFEREFGFSKKEVLGKTSVQLGINPNVKERKQLHEKIREDGALHHHDIVLYSKTGEKAYYESNSDKLVINGEEYLFNTVRNISDYKNAIRKQKENFDLIRIAGEQTKMGGWNVILSENRVYWSDEVAAIHEMPAGYAPLVEDGTNFYAPEWRDKITEAFTKCVQQGIPYDEEMEIITSSGKRVWVRTLGEAVRNKKGKIVKIQGAFQDITKRKQAEQELRESEARYKAIFETTGTATLIVGEDTTILMANNECFDMFGYDPNQLAGHKWTRFVAPESFELMMENHRLRRENPELAPRKYEVKLLNSKGGKRDVMLNINMITGTGTSVVSMLDITERKQAEDQLLQSKTNLEQYFHNDISADYVVSQSGEIVSCNKTFLNLFGFESKSEAEQFDIANLYKNPKLREEMVQELKQQRKIENRELELVSKNGRTIYAMVNSIGIYNRNNELEKIRGYIVDITQQKNTERKLKKSEEKYRRFFEEDLTGNYHVTLDGKILMCNDAFVKMLKYESKEELYKLNTSELYFTHANRETFIAQLRENRKLHNNEITLKARDGSKVEVIENVIGLFDDSGELTEFVGYMWDVTPQKKVQRELLKSEERYRLLFAHNPQPMLIYDLNTLAILEVNKAAVKHYGYTKGEFLSMTLKDIRPKEDIPALLEDVKNTNAELNGAGEWRHLKKNGEIIDVEITSHSIVFNDRNARHVLISDITERKRTEKEMLKLMHVVKQSPVSIIITDLNGNIEYVNPKLQEVSGYTYEELIGKTPSIMKSGETPDSEYETLWQAISSGVAWKGEFHNKKKNGELYWESAYISPIRNEKNEIINYVALKEDITERKKFINDMEIAKENAESNQRLFETIFDNAPIGIALVDSRTGKYLKINQSNCDMIGYSKAEMSTMDFMQITHPDDLEVDLLHMKKLRNREISYYDLEKRYISKQGKTVHVQLTIVPLLVSEAGVQTHLAIVQDISNDKKLIAQLEQNNTELVIAKEQAEQSDKLKSAFLANMSHEIRTPMNGILGFTDLLLNPNLNDAEKEHFIKIVHKSGQRMLSTVNDIVEISKIEAGIINVHSEKIDINETVKELIHFFEPEARDKGIMLQLQQLLPNERRYLFTDKNKLDSIFTNFIKNAIKYTQKGTIKIGCRETGSAIEFYVEDTGIGIPKHRLNAIFERFIQADIEDTRVFEGFGLGLAISKSYAKMLGGEIRVESEEGVGSTFYFSLPVKQDGANGAYNNGQTANNMQQEKPMDNKLKILIAEDDETSCQFLSLLVKNFSKEILEAKTGVEAVEHCRNNNDIDIIFMDIRMPEMNGYDAVRHIREFNSEVVIIAQTAYAFSSDREKAAEAGCTDFITKPIQSEELTRIVKQYFAI
ncbi:PAS domain S-box protein [Draconibacterium orientale]|uniref:PAS domain S-box protein n=1 Tax=Draconibacterium orientale TaxID=1168034 RepID=UPI0029BFDF68|nr:PAS domain S-box protein [Draconibacterium orientale]